ncbi:MAG: (E)-4-hydroxy-3-methylbut-2-enyl-diphosphate synthase, partial [Bacteroidetes bacterium]|nr:(E)-4-hydroxy-3-methylbut-2-enyl-diphosphate synthase [Bacteroidota bacterium]
MQADTASSSYCISKTAYQRFQTREVKIGDLILGGNAPIRVQSMTTTDTMNTLATVEQSIRMIEAGCELVRITAPSLKEAANLELIRNELHKRGYKTPLVADIHFTPNAAELAARIVEKVRVNPGNYADKKKFEHIEYTDSAYEAELDRIRERFTPLVKICKEYGTAMRIGTNHGSLSDRIMSRYGDSPAGMVESALEFLRIAEDNNYYNLVLSMKSSNTQVMVQAYRLLVKRMIEEGMNYPLHLGVTEAGEGEDGRIKSAVGIATLLEDGLGDTIRVSLTEEPEFEIPVARTLVNRYSSRTPHREIPEAGSWPIDPYNYERRSSRELLNIGGENPPVVIAGLSETGAEQPSRLYALGYAYSAQLDKWNLRDTACDYIYTGNHPVHFEIPGTLGIIQDFQSWQQERVRHYPLFKASEYVNEQAPDSLHFVEAETTELYGELSVKLKDSKNAVLILKTSNRHCMPDLRRAAVECLIGRNDIPIIFKRSVEAAEVADFQLHAASDLGGLLIDGLGDGIWLESSGSSI